MVKLKAQDKIKVSIRNNDANEKIDLVSIEFKKGEIKEIDDSYKQRFLNTGYFDIVES